MKEHHRTDRLTLITILLVVVTGILLITYRAPRLNYKITGEELLTLLQESDYVVTVDKALEMKNQENTVFVDLRNRDDYFIHHIEGAINIPTINILDEDVIKTLEQKDKTFILYGDEHIDANGPYMMLAKLGFQNHRVLLGGYQNFLNQGKNFPDFYQSFDELIQAEKDLTMAVEERAKILMEQDETLLKEISSGAAPAAGPATQKPAVKAFVPPPPPAEEEESEGC